jgi:hypothetical protein
MKTLLLYVILVNTTVFSQINKPKIIGEKGEELFIVDSLSFNPQFMYSEYYADTKTNKPYTGKAILKYGEKGFTLLELKNGYKDGWVIRRFIPNSIDTITENIHYYEQKEQLSIKRYFSQKSRFNYAYIGFFNPKKERTTFSIKYKENKIILCSSVFVNNEKLVKKKIKFNTPDELKLYLKDLPFSDLIERAFVYKKSYK